MIIDRDGNLLPAFAMSYGIIYKVGDWSIALKYENEEDIPKKVEMIQIKKNLTETDYYTNKYLEGLITEERWKEITDQRKAWRSRYNELEASITNPVITPEEAQEIIEKAMKKIEDNKKNPPEPVWNVDLTK